MGLVLACVFCALFVLSRWWEFGFEGRNIGAACRSGWVTLSFLSGETRASGTVYPAWQRDGWFWQENTSVVFLFNTILPYASIRAGGYHSLLIPLIWLALLAGLPTVLRRFRFVEKTGVCRKCTYDLTGNTSGACPECGTVIAKEQAATGA